MKKILSLLSLVCFFILFSFSSYGEETLIDIKQQLDRMNREIIDLQKVLYKTNKDFSMEPTNLIDISKITVFDMRLRDIENELKAINFHYENIAIEIDELKIFFENLSMNFEELNIKLSNIIINKENSVEERVILDSNKEEKQPEEKRNEINSLGTLTINSEDLSDENNDVSIKEEEKILQNLSPEEEYQLAFDFLRSQKFEEAKYALKKFIEDYPSSNLSGSAHYWLGEIFLLQKENREAALVFAEGYQQYPESIKAPDSLYKLAEALFRIEKKNEACDTMNQFLIKYSDHKLAEKTQSKINAVQCN